MRVTVRFIPTFDQWQRPRTRVELSFPSRPALWVRQLVGPKKNGGAGGRWWSNRKEQGGGHWYFWLTWSRANIVRRLEAMDDAIPEDTEVTTEKPKKRPGA